MTEENDTTTEPVLHSAEGRNGRVELLDNSINIYIYKRVLRGFDKNESKIIEIALADITDISITGLGPLGGSFTIKSVKEKVIIPFGDKEKSNFEMILAIASQKGAKIKPAPNYDALNKALSDFNYLLSGDPICPMLSPSKACIRGNCLAYQPPTIGSVAYCRIMNIDIPEPRLTKFEKKNQNASI